LFHQTFHPLSHFICFFACLLLFPYGHPFRYLPRPCFAHSPLILFPLSLLLVVSPRALLIITFGMRPYPSSRTSLIFTSRPSLCHLFRFPLSLRLVPTDKWRPSLPLLFPVILTSLPPSPQLFYPCDLFRILASQRGLHRLRCVFVFFFYLPCFHFSSFGFFSAPLLYFAFCTLSISPFFPHFRTLMSFTLFCLPCSASNDLSLTLSRLPLSARSSLYFHVDPYPFLFSFTSFMSSQSPLRFFLFPLNLHPQFPSNLTLFSGKPCASHDFSPARSFALSCSLLPSPLCYLFFF